MKGWIAGAKGRNPENRMQDHKNKRWITEFTEEELRATE